MEKIHVVGAAIRDGSKILVALRSDKMDNKMKWEFPGGKIEGTETHKQALKRELTEELAIKVDVGSHIATGYSVVNGNKIVLHVYEAVIKEGHPTAIEHKELKWVEIHEMIELDWAEADIPACRKILEIDGII
jgi:8-oxo-dGTP diphosphatase